MGWKVRQYPNKKFGLWSTISDSFIVRRTTKEKLLHEITKMLRRDAEYEIRDIKKQFPEGFIDLDTGRLIRNI